MTDEHFAVSGEMTAADWDGAATLAQALSDKSIYLVEYTVGRGSRRYFDRVEAVTPSKAVDRFIDATRNTNVQQVWQPVEWRV